MSSASGLCSMIVIIPRWWFQIFLGIFHPYVYIYTFGNYPICLYDDFQMGWFNHQVDTVDDWKKPGSKNLIVEIFS